MTLAQAVRHAVAIGLIAVPASAQIQNWRPEITTEVAPAPARAGSTVQATLRLRLPTGVHVQSDAPRDLALIPTTLTVQAPRGVSVGSVTYPRASELRQPGREHPLPVFSGDVPIVVRLAIASDVRRGTVTVPGVLRFQGCNETVCFPPSQVPVAWEIAIAK